MASDSFSDKNVAFRKLKAKSENKVCCRFGYISRRSKSDLGFEASDLSEGFVGFLLFRCVLIVMRRIRRGHHSLMGSSFVLIALRFIGVSVSTSASLGIHFLSLSFPCFSFRLRPSCLL